MTRPVIAPSSRSSSRRRLDIGLLSPAQVQLLDCGIRGIKPVRVLPAADDDSDGSVTQSFYIVGLAVDGNVYGTSSMGGYPTGAFFSGGPWFAVEWIRWDCDTYMGYPVNCSYPEIGLDLGFADELLVAEDLAGALASFVSTAPGIDPWYDPAPPLGSVDVLCTGYGAWGRATDTITGGLSPDNGWTRDTAIRNRTCSATIVVDGTLLDMPVIDNSGQVPEQIDSYLYRNVFTTVDVYPYGWFVS